VLPAGAEIDVSRRGGGRLATLVRVLTAMTASHRGPVNPSKNEPRSSQAVV
jgi:hypothetical protein